MDNQVFVVSAGEYSDWHIVAIYATEDEARAYVSDRNDRLRNEVTGEIGYGDAVAYEAYPFGRSCEPTSGAYRAGVDATGKLEYCYWHDGVGAHTPADIYQHWYQEGRPITCVGYGETREHARRSAEELRRAIVAKTILLERNQEGRIRVRR